MFPQLTWGQSSTEKDYADEDEDDDDDDDTDGDDDASVDVDQKTTCDSRIFEKLTSSHS